MRVSTGSRLVSAMLMVFACTAGCAAFGAETASSGNWPAFLGGDRAWSYSPLDQIDTSNVGRLLPAWVFATGEKGLGSTPLVVDGIMYVLAPGNRLFALNAATGAEIWRYSYPLPEGGQVRAGQVAGMAAGYGLIFVPTADNHLVAVDAKTGREVWDVQVDDYVQCRCRPSFAPILAKDKVIVGAAGETGPSKYLAAFDAKTGKQAWRFLTIPGPGEPGHDSWPGDSWKSAGGPTWYVGSYDPELGLVYWGVGNPGPAFSGDRRKGDNLYSASLLALDVDTGKLKWHYQAVPHDIWEFDSTGEPILVDLDRNGRTLKLVVHATKSGFTYVLNRRTGELVSAWPHSEAITWTHGLDKAGHAIDPLITGPEAKLVCPSGLGSHGGEHSAYSPRTGWWYNTSLETCAETKLDPPSGKGASSQGGTQTMVRSPNTLPFIGAFDPLTGVRQWTFQTKGLNAASPFVTAGNLVFGGDIFGEAWALDATNGKKLWSFRVGSGVISGAMSYAVNGRQYVAIGSGWGDSVAGSAPVRYNEQFFPEMKGQLPPGDASTLFVFALPDNATSSAVHVKE